MVGRPGSGFSFLDAGDTVRRLGIDRLTLDRWMAEGRIKAHRGMGRDVFFRVRDVDELYKETHPDAELAEALADDEQESSVEGTAVSTSKKKQHDPQMRVYLRLQADAKWYDISAEDIEGWVQQLQPEGCERHLSNVQQAIDKLRYLSDQLEAIQQREAPKK
jgi:predicted site-specific integrase-resolvase